MLASQIPAKFTIPFANAAGGSYIRTVPIPSQIGITPGAASFTDGFPPLNFLSDAAGGVPPFGQDMNGLLNAMSAWNRWQAAGGPVFFDAVWSGAVGGYPKGARVLSAATQGVSWLCTADNNTNNPDVTPTNWIALDRGMVLVGDVGGAANANVIGSGKVTSGKIANNAVGISQLLQATVPSLLGRTTAGTGNLALVTFSTLLNALGFGGVASANGNIQIPFSATQVGVFNWGTAGSMAAGATQPVTFSQAMTTPFRVLPVARGDGGSTDNAVAQEVNGTLTGSGVTLKLQNVTGSGSAPAQIVDYFAVGLL